MGDPEPTLLNQGRFTSFGGIVPHLLSGTAQEWERMSMLLLEAYQGFHHTASIFSDMVALIYINIREHPFVYYEKTTGLMDLYDLKPVTKNSGDDPYSIKSICDKTSNRVAVHFSHKDCYVTQLCHERREFAYTWINEWKKHCKTTHS